jgi:hypothetical protein
MRLKWRRLLTGAWNRESLVSGSAPPIKMAIVVAGNLGKFGQHADLRKFLLGTGDRVLVEASPLDAVRGIGLAADDPRASGPAEWPGQNLLGLALAEVRATLAAS